MALESIKKIRENFDVFKENFFKIYDENNYDDLIKTYEISLKNLENNILKELPNVLESGSALDTLYILRESFNFCFDDINNDLYFKNVSKNKISNETHKYLIKDSLYSFIEDLYDSEINDEISYSFLIKKISSPEYTNEILLNFPVIYYIYLNRVFLTSLYLKEVIANTKKILKDKNNESLLDIDLFLGDIHNLGRFTIKLKFTDSNLFYKPRNVKIDELYYAHIVNSSTKINVFHSNENFGLVEEIKYTGNKDNLNPKFYFEWGKLLGLCQLLNSHDIINENVIYNDGLPILCDVECLFTPRTRKNKLRSEIYDIFYEYSEYSIFKTNIIEKSLNDSYTSSPLFRKILTEANLPKSVKKSEININNPDVINTHLNINETENKDKIIEDLNLGYDYFYKYLSKKIFIEMSEYLNKDIYKNRVLLKHTKTYSDILFQSKKAIHLTNMESYVSFFNVISKQKYINKNISNNERIHLMIDDYPIYTSVSNNKNLLNGNYEIVEENYFSKEYKNYIEKRFNEINYKIQEDSKKMVNIYINYFYKDRSFFKIDEKFTYIQNLIKRSVEYKGYYFFLEIALKKESNNTISHVIHFDSEGFLSGVAGIYYTLDYLKEPLEIVKKYIFDPKNINYENIISPSIYVGELSNIFIYDKINNTNYLLKAIKNIKDFDSKINLSNYDFFSGFLLTYTIITNKKNIDVHNNDNIKSLIENVYNDRYHNTWGSIGISHGLLGIIPLLAKFYKLSNDRFYMKYIYLYYREIINRIDFDNNELYFDENNSYIAVPGYSNGSIGLYFCFKYLFSLKIINMRKFSLMLNFTILNIRKHIEFHKKNLNITTGISGVILCLKDIKTLYPDLINESNSVWVDKIIFEYNTININESIMESLSSTSLFSGISGWFYLNKIKNNYDSKDNILDMSFFEIYD